MEKIRKKVESVIKEVDKQLVVTNLIVAKSMQSNINIDNYTLSLTDYLGKKKKKINFF